MCRRSFYLFIRCCFTANDSYLTVWDLILVFFQCIAIYCHDIAIYCHILPWYRHVFATLSTVYFFQYNISYANINTNIANEIFTVAQHIIRRWYTAASVIHHSNIISAHIRRIDANNIHIRHWLLFCFALETNIRLSSMILPSYRRIRRQKFHRSRKQQPLLQNLKQTNTNIDPYANRSMEWRAFGRVQLRETDMCLWMRKTTFMCARRLAKRPTLPRQSAQILTRLISNTLSHSVDLNAVAQQLRCVLLLLHLRHIHTEYRLFVSGACGTLRASRLTVCCNWLTVCYNPRAIPVTKVEHPKCRSLPA